MKKRSIETEVVHAGTRQPMPEGLPNSTPLFTSSTYSYPTMEDSQRVFTGELDDFIYSRYGNPTVAALQDLFGFLRVELLPGHSRPEWRPCTRHCWCVI